MNIDRIAEGYTEKYPEKNGIELEKNIEQLTGLSWKKFKSIIRNYKEKRYRLKLYEKGKLFMEQNSSLISMKPQYSPVFWEHKSPFVLSYPQGEG